MKTTLVLDDGVFDSLRREALRTGETMSALVESALRRFLRVDPKGPRLAELPVHGLGAASVDLADREQLHRRMESREELRSRYVVRESPAPGEKPGRRRATKRNRPA